MSKFPIVDQLSVPQAAGYNAPQVVSADVTAVPEATAKLGQVLEKTGGVLLEIKDRHEKFNYSIAKSKALQQSVNLETELDQSPDYANLPQKYQEGMKKIKDETKKSLGENGYSQKLEEDLNLYQAQRFGQVLKTSEAKQQAYGMATAAKEEDANLDAFLKAKDPNVQKDILSATKDNFALSIPYSDPNRDLKIQKYNEDVNKRFVTTQIASLPPQQQLNILNGADKDTEGKGIARMLPADERMKLKDRAEMLLEQQKNDAERAAAKAERQAKLNVDNELLKGASSGVAFDQLPIAVQLKASNEDVARYDAVRQKQLGEGKVQATEQEKNYWDYKDMYVKDPTKFSEISPLKIAADVPSNKIAELQKLQQKTTVPASIAAFHQVANGTIKQIGYKLTDDTGKTQAADFKTRLNEESEIFQEAHKRPPTVRELQDMAHDLVVKQSFEKDSLWGGTEEKRKYQVPRGRAIAIPNDFREKAYDEARKLGRPKPTDEEIRKVYIRFPKLISDAGAAEVTNTNDLLPVGKGGKKGFLPDQSPEAEKAYYEKLGDSRGRPTNIKK